MDTEKCKVLLCAIETGSFSATAEKLGYTPSGISRMMAAMESEMGFPLLSRSRMGVTPTMNCEKMLPVIRELVRLGEQFDQMSAEICGLVTGKVSIGVSYYAYYRWLFKLIVLFREIYPNIEVNILEGNSSSLSSAMDEGRADLCIISRREGNFRWITLLEDPMVAWVPETHPLAAAEKFPIHAYETEPFIDTFPGQDTDNARILARNNIKPNIRFTTSDSLATYYMVEAGLGMSLNNSINGKDLNGTVAIVPLDPPQTVEIGIAIPLHPSMSPAANKFIDFAKAHITDL